jgi:hypothetical protein
MVSRDASKGTTSQRRRRLHRGPLNIPEENFQMPNISMEKFSTFFGNTLEDAEQHLFRFQCACEIFNLTKDNVTCILFLQTMHGNALEWYSSLFPGTITSWDILEDLFVERFSHPPSPIWTQDNEMINFEEESNQGLDEFSESSHVDKDENSNLQKENFGLSYTPYEDISRRKFENEIKEPPPNTKEYFSLATEDENLQEHLQQEELVKELNLEKNDEQDSLQERRVFSGYY